MVFFVDFKVDDWTAVHFIFQVIFGHVAGNQVPEVVLGETDLVGNVGDHESSHLLGVGEGAVGDVGHEVHAGYPGEGVPKLPVVIILVTSVVAQRRP